ncbi:MAG: (2Fe-2S)-binding protein [Burkholderiaceae bacterium]
MTDTWQRERPITLTVNGASHALTVGGQATLLQVLRNDLGLNGPKYGCGLGQCGACTVHVDGVAARACVIPAAQVQDRRITTLEGLGDRLRPHVVQQAFIQAQAAQCGYCLNGMIMTTAALLARDPCPDPQAVRDALSGNLCRCGTHVEILAAVEAAVATLAAQAPTTDESR